MNEQARRRGVAATRAIFQAGADENGVGGGGVEWLEAATLEKVDALRGEVVEEAARRIVASPEAEAEVARVAATFFGEPPRTAAEVAAERVGHLDPGGIAAPGSANPNPNPSDDRRDVPEVERAATALGLAVRMDGRLRTAVGGAADRLEAALNAALNRPGADADSASKMLVALRELRQCIEAAGTMPAEAPPRPSDADVAAAEGQAHREGRGLDVAMRAGQLADEWRTLHDAGQTRLTRERYVDLRLMREGLLS